DLATVLVTDDPPDRTILWHQGAQIVKGDRIDIAALFAHDLVVLDLPDLPLVRFLTDLPAHTAPRTRLLGTLTYLADMPPDDAFALALRHDAIVGCERDLLVIAGERDLDAAVAALQRGIRISNLRTAVITRGGAGCLLVEAERTDLFSAIAVTPVDPTGAGDAFAAGLAYGMALRWPWPRAVRFANVVGGLAVRALGAQTSLPSLAEAERWLADQPAPEPTAER
ncbi:MAG TPA: carbohydrate kinase family protein, partial [Thermomicrobiales bacterium]|nr:carbohydrate kinase family protein [Thermomicrobiales bacterium]